MKNTAIVIGSVLALFISFSCGDELEKGIDCVAESTFVQLKHTADATNENKIDYKIEYSGTYTLTSVKWTFGDGTTETINGNTVSHTYASAGTYTVKADVTIRKGGNRCTSSPTKSVTVN